MIEYKTPTEQTWTQHMMQLGWKQPIAYILQHERIQCSCKSNSPPPPPLSPGETHSSAFPFSATIQHDRMAIQSEYVNDGDHTTECPALERGVAVVLQQQFISDIQSTPCHLEKANFLCLIQAPSQTTVTGSRSRHLCCLSMAQCVVHSVVFGCPVVCCVGDCL